MAGPAVTSLVVDLLFGEPPTALHPTVAMGGWLTERKRRRRATSPAAELLEGLFAVGSGVAITAVAAAVAERAVRVSPDALQSRLRGVALKPALSLRALLAAGRRVQHLLEQNQLVGARRSLARDLVSRDTSRLSRSEVAGAAIESVAENLSDGLVGPLVAFRAGGLPAAYAYRMINTADAMLGYRTPELEWFGKAAAISDDVVNLVPARLSAALISLAAPIGGGSTRAAIRVSRRDAANTASPNAGWPMAAMAGALGVRLTKRGHYALNVHARRPTPRDIDRCCVIAGAAGGLAAILADVL